MDAKPAVSPSLTDNPRCDQWLAFRQDGVVVLKTSKVEIGQGILTALVQIAADELDVDPARFEVLSGHTALSPVEAQTSSSISVETTGLAVRHAASATRELLLNEAAKLLQARREDVSFKDGAVWRNGEATDLTAWSLADVVALDQPVVDFSRPKPVAERRIVGTPMPRLDLREKTSGAPFIHDLSFDGMLHGRVLSPPAPTRRLKSFDAEAFATRHPAVTLVRDGSFVGVVAEREEHAVAAIETVARLATWQPDTTGIIDFWQAILDAAPAPELIVEKGASLPTTATADPPQRTFSTTIRKPFIAHASIAPSCAIARWKDEGLQVHSHSQGVHGVQDALAMAFDIPVGNVTVMHAPGAGTYGHSGQDDVAMDAALLARAVPGSHVRVLWDRAADFAASPAGPAMVVHAQAVVDTLQQRITHFDIESISQPQARRPGRGGIVGMVSAELLAEPAPSACPDDVPAVRGGGTDRNACPLYAIPNVRVAKRTVKDVPWRASALRGLGAYANVYAIETLLDDMASEIKVDPVKFRLDHLDDERARAVVSRCADMAQWPGEAGDGAALGLGFAQYKNRASYCAVAVRVEVDEEVKATHAWAVIDAGEAINPDGIKNQVEGGIIQSLSWTLKEALAVEGDAIVTADWPSYPILRFSEVPKIDVALIDRPEMPPLGVGEVATGPTAAAVGNAVCRALGVRVRQLPLTRDAIVSASH